MIFKDTKSAGEAFGNAVIGLGNFDGVHIGHQEILKIAINIAKQQNLKVGILTFDPHPAIVLKKNSNHKLLMPFEARLQKLLSYGLDFVIVTKFTPQLSKLKANEFIEEILLKQLSIAHCVTGCNFRFGYRGEGNSELLQAHAQAQNFGYTKVDQVTFEGTNISTSWIKALLKEGRIEKAKKLLGHNYSLAGQVQQGKQIASTLLDTPTANIKIDPNAQTPLLGVYLIQAIYDSKVCYGIANLGVRPTINSDNQPFLEVHFFDFNQNLYNQTLNIELLAFLRPERKFDGIPQLKHTIASDKTFGRYILKNLKFYPNNK